MLDTLVTIIRVHNYFQCGGMPFARVADEWSDQDQSVPSSVAAQLARRDDSPSPVRAIAIDTNFAAVDPSQ